MMLMALIRIQRDDTEDGKKTICIVVIVVVAVICVIMAMFVFQDNNKSSLSDNEIAMNHISLSENTLTIRGDIVASAKSYRNCTYHTIGDNLYVTVKPAVTYKRTTKEDRIPPKGHENPQRGN
jgi:flagellar basal body-associated protein FliL